MKDRLRRGGLGVFTAACLLWIALVVVCWIYERLGGW